MKNTCLIATLVLIALHALPSSNASADENARIDAAIKLRDKRDNVQTTNSLGWGVAYMAVPHTAPVMISAVLGSMSFQYFIDQYYEDKINKQLNPADRKVVADPHLRASTYAGTLIAFVLVAKHSNPLLVAAPILASYISMKLSDGAPQDKTMQSTGDTVAKLKSSSSPRERTHLSQLAADATDYLAGAQATEDLSQAFETWRSRAVALEPTLGLGVFAKMNNEDIAQTIVGLNSIME